MDRAVLGERRLFPHLEARAYLNHAAISPPSTPVARAAAAVIDSYASRGVDAFMGWMDQRAALKEDLAGLVGAGAADLGLVANTTTAVIDVAMCLPWRSGDGILLFEGEFPTNVTPWRQAAQTFGLRIEALPLTGFGDGSGDGLTRVEAALTRGGIRLIAVSAVQFQTGLRMPLRDLAALAHRHGAELFVDGIQAVGGTPVDVVADGIDYLAVGSHKWLMGLEGSGFLYVAPDRIASLVPRIAGWLSHVDGMGFLFDGPGHLRYDRAIRATTDFVEIGAPNTTGLAALHAAVGLIAQIGPAAIFDHVQGYHDLLEAGLVDRGFTSVRATSPSGRSTILSVLPPPTTTDREVVAHLSAHGVAVTNPDGHVRFAPHWPNAIDEIDHVLAVLDIPIR